jgi:hypothetical protein
MIMAKVRTYRDPISPIGTFNGKWVTEIRDTNGVTAGGRGFTRSESRQIAEDRYDTKIRGA